ncbi:MAG: hypothetical protein AAGA95_00535 [Pseudomonadota bacterium]
MEVGIPAAEQFHPFRETVDFAWVRVSGLEAFSASGSLELEHVGGRVMLV